MISMTPHQSSEAVTIQIAEQIAEKNGIDPRELTPPLYSAIDTEALNTLFESTKNGPREGEITFEYNGYTVRVVATETVGIEIIDPSQ